MKAGKPTKKGKPLKAIAPGQVVNARLTDFADYTDLVALLDYCELKDVKPSVGIDRGVGDNGRGAWGDVTATDQVAMCALPKDQVLALFGSLSKGRGALIKISTSVTLQPPSYITAELRDIAPSGSGVCDLNPGAVKLLGLVHPVSTAGNWQWTGEFSPVKARAKMVKRSDGRKIRYVLK